MRREEQGTAAELWRERLRRFEEGSLSVREFCEREGVSQPSFYHWRKRLAAAPPRPSSPGTRSAFQALQVTPIGAGLAIDLPGGARVEVAADQVELARAVVREVALVAQRGGGSC